VDRITDSLAIHYDCETRQCATRETRLIKNENKRAQKKLEKKNERIRSGQREHGDTGKTDYRLCDLSLFTVKSGWSKPVRRGNYIELGIRMPVTRPLRMCVLLDGGAVWSPGCGSKRKCMLPESIKCRKRKVRPDRGSNPGPTLTLEGRTFGLARIGSTTPSIHGSWGPLNTS
jgi:hypothetical protein